MIPGQFSYLNPASKSEALKMLADGGLDARPLAGGHSLIPMMKLRMAQPSQLIDIAKLDELRRIEISRSEVTIGASVTQHEMIESVELHEACPIIRETALLIADPQIRYCGTLGGNIGNGDPGNDMPGLMQCLDATYVVESTTGIRKIKAREFYQSAYFTALEPGEIITHVSFVPAAKEHGYAYTKLKRKVGDYATAAAAVMLEMSKGKVTGASIALTNLSDTPLYAAAAVEAIISTGLEASDIKSAADAAMAITNPVADGRGSAAYKTAMAGVMVTNALEKAKDRAGDVKSGGVFGWLKN